MSEFSNNERNRRNRNVSIPDFRNETDRQYQYSSRPNQRDYLKGTEWDREEELRQKREQEAYERRQRELKKSVSQKKKQNGKTKPSAAQRKRRKRNLKYAAMAVMLVLAVLAGNIVGRWNAQINQVLNQRKTSDIDLQEVKVDESLLDSDSEIINILLIGADKRENWSESGRSDATMIATLDMKHKRLKLTSLMRDMYIDIPNHGKNKFNAAYSYGGVELLYQTIAYNFDLKLDGYVLVDFGAFKHVIKKLGGVKIELTQAEADYLVKAYKRGTVTKVKPGMNNLNGSQALAYTRIRQDSAADFGRTARQRKVLQSIFTKIKTKSYSQLVELAGEIMPYITTDLTNDEIFSYMSSIVMMGTTELDQKRIPIDNSFDSQRINNMAVLVPDLAVNKKALQEFIFEFGGEEEETKDKQEDT